jgi:hypothetical protein
MARLAMLLVLGLGALAPPARADDPRGEPTAPEVGQVLDAEARTLAAADALFREGRQLVADGRLGEGCARLQRSFDLRARIGVQANLADCYARLGKTATAWRLFQDAAAAAERRGDPRAPLIRRRADELARALTRLVLVVEDAHRDGLVLRRDGEPIAPEDYGAELTLDPGEHRLEAMQPGRRSWSTRITLTRGELRAIRVPELRPTEPLAAPPPRLLTAGTWVAAGIAVAGVAAGTGFGLRAWSLARAIEAGCDSTGRCTPEALADAERSHRDGLISTAAFAVGGAALITAVVLHRRSRAQDVHLVPLTSPTTAGVALGGGF